MSTPVVDETRVEAGPWRPPPTPYEAPTTTPRKINRAERRAALTYRQAIGVLDRDGRPSRRWKTTLGAIFG